MEMLIWPILGITVMGVLFFAFLKAVKGFLSSDEKLSKEDKEAMAEGAKDGIKQILRHIFLFK